MYTETLFHAVVADRARERNRSMFIDRVQVDEPARAPRRITRRSPAYLRGIPASVWRSAMSRPPIGASSSTAARYGTPTHA
jgi:hypothetical protein